MNYLNYLNNFNNLNNRHINVAVGRAFHRTCVVPVLAALSVATGISGAAAQNTVPAAFQGAWVPSKATCESAVRVLVAADVLTLVNGKDSAALGGIVMAGPGFFPPGYRGIEAVLITEFDGHQPVTATFNPGEKKGAAQVEFAPVMAGNVTAQAKAYNARISKLNLAQRFPLDKVPLKKCTSGPGAAPAR